MTTLYTIDDILCYIHLDLMYLKDIHKELKEIHDELDKLNKEW